MFGFVKNIHFVGIGGAGMSGIAEVLYNLDYNISGSDICENSSIKLLKYKGIKIFIGHDKNNISRDTEVIVISSVIKEDNPEVLFARLKKIPVIFRADMLVELMRLKYSILIAGTHGKTTTTSMISWCMYKLGFDPTIIIGGKLKNIDSMAKLGNGKFFVAEADESDGSFLKYNPVISVVTNIDNDHLNFYNSMENLKKAFFTFINKVPFYGFCVLCNDNEYLREFSKIINKKCITYGIDNKSDIMAKNICLIDKKQFFSIYKNDLYLGDVYLNVFGKHNILNALSTIALLLEFDVNFKNISLALSKFAGVKRRLEKKGHINSVIVFDDYGHHPTEMQFSWNTIKKIYFDYKKIVIFQPHRFSRTKELAFEFAKVLSCMDNVCVLPIYAAGEINIDNINISEIFKFLTEEEKNKIKYFENKKKLLVYLDKNIDFSEKTLILTLGAGDVYKIGEDFIKKYQ